MKDKVLWKSCSVIRQQVLTITHYHYAKQSVQYIFDFYEAVSTK